MDINRLNEFIVLSECLNYSKAANILFITQPVLSRHIHDLEDMLGTQLFIRDTHKVELTETGKIAAAEIKTALEALNSSIKNIKAAADNLNGSLKLGFLGHAVKPFLISFINDFSAHNPNIRIEYAAYDLDDLFTDLQEEVIDVGFTTHLPLNRMDEINSHYISNDRLCVVLPPGHPLQGREEVSMEELQGEAIIAFSPQTNPVTADFHRQLFDNFNIRMNVVKYVDKVDTAIFFVGLGDGIFLLPRHLTFMAGSLTSIPLKDSRASIPLNLVWKKSNSKPSLQRFVKSFSAFYKELNS